MTDRFRVGRHLGRTVYRVVGEGPSERDELIGLMDTPELGALVVEALNARERVRGAPERRDPSLPQSCQDADGNEVPSNECVLSGPHYVTHPVVAL